MQSTVHYMFNTFIGAFINKTNQSFRVCVFRASNAYFLEYILESFIFRTSHTERSSNYTCCDMVLKVSYFNIRKGSM